MTSRSHRLAVPRSLLCGLVVASAACGDGPAVVAPIFPKTELPKGEICEPDNSAALRIRFDPPTLVVSPGASRPVRVVVDPDLCEPHAISLVAASSAVSATSEVKVDLRHPSATFEVSAKSLGKTTITRRRRRCSRSLLSGSSWRPSRWSAGPTSRSG